MAGTAEAPVRRVSADRLVGQRVDRYDILYKLASGGMGAVYVARSVSVGGFERLVAIKVLHAHLAEEEEFITMLLDEARLAARIRHPNVVSTLDVAHWEDLHFLVMEYVEGDHLAGLLTRAHTEGLRLPLRPVLRVVVEALSGLAAAHQLTDSQGESLNLVHRDVSPHNILVGTDGISRLTDFGVAKAEYRLSSTRQGQFKGKLAYTAPETASQAHAEQRSDLFAMGVVTWEALTTNRLFKAKNNVTLLKRLLEDPIPLPSTVDPGLAPFDPVMAKALCRDLDGRFQSAQEMIEAIELAAGELEGVGTSREVSELVSAMAATKLDGEKAAIRTAIERLGAEPPQAYSTGRHAPVEPDVVEAPTVAAKTVTEISQADQKKRVPLWIVVAAVLAVVLGVGAAWIVSQSGGEEPDPDAPLASDPVDEVPTPDEGGDEGTAVGDEGATAQGGTEGQGETEGAADAGTAGQGEGETGQATAEGGSESATPEETPEERRRRLREERRAAMRGMMSMRTAMMDDDVLSNPYRQQ